MMNFGNPLKWISIWYKAPKTIQLNYDIQKSDSTVLRYKISAGKSGMSV